ncbi:hypothetical protein [Lactiplantibacillus plajomi]|uniref:Uncharacterized protein n=1 Tax=Lactiplantibacillus plajomi TaxID=1457217 RepID=A0ABV6K299_9LACO|nr:hypothetical protein [Lactiplantibacillus plajomi]
MKIDLLPARVATPLAILSMTNLDNRELNPAIEKQLSMQAIPVAQPQSALADLLQLIGSRHAISMQAWDMAALGGTTVQVKVTPDKLALQDLTANPLPANLNKKSSRVLVIIGQQGGSDEVVHATAQELQRKIKAFFGIQARLQFRTCYQTAQTLETTRSDESA